MYNLFKNVKNTQEIYLFELYTENTTKLSDAMSLSALTFLKCDSHEYSCTVNHSLHSNTNDHEYYSR